MPRTNNITIHTADLQQILTELAAKKRVNELVTIVDQDDFFVVRDTSGFQITSVSKTEE